MKKKPWIEGSLEVLELSIEQYFMGVFSDTEIDRNRYMRASLINADNAAELCVKAFIEYSRTSRASSNFYENLQWIREKGSLADPSCFKELEKSVRYHHKQRDTVYHHRYLMVVDRADTLDCIINVMALFKLLFQDEFERSVERNLRRRILVDYAHLEQAIVDCCTGLAEFSNESDLQDLVLKMLDATLIDNELAQLLQQVLLRQEELIPKVESLGKIEDSFELVNLISDLVSRITPRKQAQQASHISESAIDMSHQY